MSVPKVLGSMVGVLVLVAAAKPPRSPSHDDSRWTVVNQVDGGSCEAQIELHPSGSGCKIGREVEAVFAHGQIEIYDTSSGAVVPCGQQMAVCGANFQCDCRRAAQARGAPRPRRSAPDGGPSLAR